MLQTTVPRTTSALLTAATLTDPTPGLKPVPVAVSVAGSVPEFGVNDQDGAAVNVEVAVGV